MASQIQGVTHNARLGVDQEAAMRGRMSQLPAILRQRERTEDIEMQKEQFNRTMGFKNEQRRIEERAREAQMGLSAAKLGLTASMGSNYTLGQLPFIKRFATPGSAMGNIKTGDIVGSGLAGFGTGKMVGGKSKAKKGLYGAGAGGLLSMLSGGNIFTGMATGGIGGLFS
jgi:hypothetical protein